MMKILFNSLLRNSGADSLLLWFLALIRKRQKVHYRIIFVTDRISIHVHILHKYYKPITNTTIRFCMLICYAFTVK